MSIKLVAIDLDGTLLNDHHEINQPVVDCIKKARRAGYMSFFLLDDRYQEQNHS